MTTPPSTSYLLAQTRSFVKYHMSQPHFDASHDYSHILRVLALSKHILSVEKKSNPSIVYNPTIIELCALLHDIADHKYVPSTSSFPPSSPSSSTTITPLTFLLSLSCPPNLAHNIQEAITAISYSAEISSPAGLMQEKLRQYPEIAIVQDADRLDALGAVGIGRAFTFGGAKGVHGMRVKGMQSTVDHFEEKLEKLEGLMKTGEGRRLAAERTERVRAFRRWWEEEGGGVVDAGGEEGDGDWDVSSIQGNEENMK